MSKRSEKQSRSRWQQMMSLHAAECQDRLVLQHTCSQNSLIQLMQMLLSGAERQSAIC